MNLFRRSVLALAIFSLILPSPVGATDSDAEGGANLPPAEDSEVLSVSPEVETKSPATESDLAKQAASAHAVRQEVHNSVVAPKTSNVDAGVSDRVSDGRVDDQEDVVYGESSSLRISKIKTDGSGAQEFVEIHNPTDDLISLQDVQIHFLTANFDGPEDAPRPTRILYRFAETDTIEPRSFFVIRHQAATNIPADAVFESNYRTGSLAVNGSVRLMIKDSLVDLVGWGSANKFWGDRAKDDGKGVLQRCQLPGGNLLDSEDNSVDFQIYDTIQLRQLVMCPEHNEEDEVDDHNSLGSDSPTVSIPKNKCEGLRLSEIGANLDNSDQFIEVTNTNSKSVNIKGCKLMTNRSKTAEFVFDDRSLKSKEYFAVKIEDTDLRLTKTTSGTVYILDSEGNEVDSVNYKNLPKDTSWSLVGDDWRVTYKITAGKGNIYQRWPACQEGYFRNEATGRCNKIPVVEPPKPCKPGYYRSKETGRCRKIQQPKQLKPCKPGQYRNPETGRCRSMASGAKALKPCKPGQYRHPETNRCRKIQTASTLKPCKPGYERNPETNRCRKVRSAKMPMAGFASEDVKEIVGSTIGWWTLGGVSILAAGYASWQWRSEVGRLIRRIGGVFVSSNK